MDTTYEGDYRCQASECEDDHCSKVATHVRREPYTPGRFQVLLCDEHADNSYEMDTLATADLLRKVKIEQ